MVHVGLLQQVENETKTGVSITLQIWIQGFCTQSTIKFHDFSMT